MAVLLKWISGGLEALLGIPFLGGTIIIALVYVPLGVMLIVHIATLIICIREDKSKAGSILGIVTNVLAWIPFLGMVMHIITAVILLVSAYQDGRAEKQSYN